jgi:hypothetical protein
LLGQTSEHANSSQTTNRPLANQNLQPPKPTASTSPTRFFQRRAPFAVPGGGELGLEHLAPAYQVLDAFQHRGVDGVPSVVGIIAESRQLQEWQDLFELYVQVGVAWGVRWWVVVGGFGSRSSILK